MAGRLRSPTSAAEEEVFPRHLKNQTLTDLRTFFFIVVSYKQWDIKHFYILCFYSLGLRRTLSVNQTCTLFIKRKKGYKSTFLKLSIPFFGIDHLTFP